MRRILQIACVSMAIVAIAMPFDCMAAMQSAHAMDCCTKGKCHHGKNADDCCRNMAAASAGVVSSLPPASHSVLPPHVLFTNHAATVVPALYSTAKRSPQDSSSRGSPPDSLRNLPLLI